MIQDGNIQNVLLYYILVGTAQFFFHLNLKQS